MPDRKGSKVDVVLGYPTVQDYELNTCFLGAVVGRYANRIGGSKFTLYEDCLLYTSFTQRSVYQ